jgi:hypothetical protein
LGQAADKPNRYGVSWGNRNDGDHVSAALGHKGSFRSVYDHDIHFELNQLGGQFWQLLRLELCGFDRQDEVLPFHPPALS